MNPRYRDMHRAGHSMLLVSHEPRTIAAFCDRAILLEGGRIIAAGPAAEVAERYLSLLVEEQAPAPEPVALPMASAVPVHRQASSRAPRPKREAPVPRPPPQR